MKPAIKSISIYVIAIWASAALAGADESGTCSVQSAATRTPVVELYTSEGCSSCPPADKWLSTLKTARDGKSSATPLVVQAFHVGYWDYIGWVDRFANPTHTTRQRQLARFNGLVSIYTPQAVLDGRDWRDWGRLTTAREPAQAHISLKKLATDQFEAQVTPVAGAPDTWSAYWTITEHGHSSKVKSGENAGEFLQHDFVVRQYTAAGDYATDLKAPQKLTWRSIAMTPGHPRQVNLVVFDPKTGKALQAVSAACG